MTDTSRQTPKPIVHAHFFRPNSLKAERIQRAGELKKVLLDHPWMLDSALQQMNRAYQEEQILSPKTCLDDPKVINDLKASPNFPFLDKRLTPYLLLKTRQGKVKWQQIAPKIRFCLEFLNNVEIESVTSLNFSSPFAKDSLLLVAMLPAQEAKKPSGYFQTHADTIIQLPSPGGESPNGYKLLHRDSIPLQIPKNYANMKGLYQIRQYMDADGMTVVQKANLWMINASGKSVHVGGSTWHGHSDINSAELSYPHIIDANGDGLPDFIFGQHVGSWSIALMRADGSFENRILEFGEEVGPGC